MAGRPKRRARLNAEIADLLGEDWIVGPPPEEDPYWRSRTTRRPSRVPYTLIRPMGDATARLYNNYNKWWVFSFSQPHRTTNVTFAAWGEPRAKAVGRQIANELLHKEPKDIMYDYNEGTDEWLYRTKELEG